jgi:hypothetical protein
MMLKQMATVTKDPCGDCIELQRSEFIIAWDEAVSRVIPGHDSHQESKAL